MLSIWKLAAGQEAYYLNSVADGVEDYYTGGEAPGRWTASSDRLLGLVGEVDADDLHTVLEGRDPNTGSRLGQPHKVPGFDLTFRAPKSVSVLFGLGELGIAHQVSEAHDQAVDAALDWVERHAVWSRRGKGGVRQVRTEGLIAAAFKHRTSRNGDPHLHTHVLVPNMVLGEDGKWATPDARWFYASAKTAGYLYEAQLRHNLTAALGVAWGAVTNGIADIEHIPADVLKAFSTRRAEIEKRMEARGQHSAKAAMIAALDTRKTKQADPGTVELRTRWADQAREMGYDPSRLREAIGRTSVSPISDTGQATIEIRLLGAEGLTSHDSTFDRHDILRAWCDSLPAGAPIGRIEELTEALIARPEIAVLGDTGHGDVIRDASGRVISVLPAQERWSTVELLDIERAALATAEGLLGAERGVCGDEAVQAALRNAPTLADEQVRAVVQMTQSGNGVDVLTAPAGSGKTFTFAAAREAWERAGFHVIGAAHSGVAADELAMAGGIPATTIARLLMAIDNNEPGRPDQRTVLVIDETGTAGTRDLARLLAEIDRTGAKAVLAGDAKQLPEIAAGGLFAGIGQRLPMIELHDNRRQQHEWEQEALRDLRDGDTGRALTAYLERGRITIGHDAHHTKTLLLADWWAAYVAGDDAMMLAGRRADVAELNLAGHLRAETGGMLTGPTLDMAGMPVRAGDKVMMLCNNIRLGVRNGNRGTVVAVDPDARTLQVRLARGVVDIPADYIDIGNVGLAYAMTVHKAHGTTCDATMMLADDLLYRELAYEAMSRGRKTNRVYISRTTLDDLDLQLEDGPHTPAEATIGGDPLDVLAVGLERRRNKQLALDHISTTPLDTWGTPALLAEQRRIKTVLGQAPPDQTADLERLTATRAELAPKIDAARAEVEQLQRRKRPRKQRKTPDVELHAGQHKLARLEGDVERLDQAIAAGHASQHRRNSHLAAHHADRIALGEIAHVLNGRLREQTTRTVQDPPSYITKTLGPRPADRRHDKVWVRTVVQIEQYRFDHDITDHRTLIGRQPQEPLDTLGWLAVRDTIKQAHRALAPQPQPSPHVEHRVRGARTTHEYWSPSREGPSLDMGL
ncbi:MAG: MobF family relaxase [Acidimicrobiia bacterium]